MHLGWIVIRLRMIAVNLRHASGREVVVDKALPVAHRKSKIGNPALIAASRGITNDDRKHIDAQMIVVRPQTRAADQEAPVAAAEVENDGGTTAEKLSKIKRTRL